MASTTAICSSFKKELFEASHDFNNVGNEFRWALYTSAATNGAATTTYTTPNEVVGTGYTAGGTTVPNVDPVLSGTTAILDWPDPTWPLSTFTAASTLLYNNTLPSKASCAVWNFGSDQIVSGGSFILVLPAPAAATAILRLA